ncbi:hypothetical protein LCGC14_3159020, partial [marine sediment metagenome]
ARVSKGTEEILKATFTGLSSLQPGDTVSFFVSKLRRAASSRYAILLPYNGAGTVTSTGSISIASNTFSQGSYLDFSLTQAFINALSDQGSNTFSVRYYCWDGDWADCTEISEVIADISSGGGSSTGEDWQSTNKATAQDNDETYVSFTTTTESKSDYLQLDNFGFNIPSGATIDGIEVLIDREANISQSIQDDIITLKKSSGPVGNNEANTGTSWTTTDDGSYDIYGSSTYLWGTSWSQADINDNAFGVNISVSYNGTTDTRARIDHVQIKVYYTEGTTTQDDGIIRPDGDSTSEWNSSHIESHSNLINEAVLNVSRYIFTSSLAPSNVSDVFS